MTDESAGNLFALRVIDEAEERPWRIASRTILERVALVSAIELAAAATGAPAAMAATTAGTTAACASPHTRSRRVSIFESDTKSYAKSNANISDIDHLINVDIDRRSQSNGFTEVRITWSSVGAYLGRSQRIADSAVEGDWRETAKGTVTRLRRRIVL